MAKPMEKFSQLTGGQKAVFITLAVLLFAVLGPVLGAAAFAAQSLFMFGVWATAAAAGMIFWPVLNRIMKTWALKLAKANARMNPIETLELDYQNKKDALDRFTVFVKKMIAAHKVSQDELNQLKEEFPEKKGELAERQAIMDGMAQMVAVLRSKAGEADEKLEAYWNQIRFIKADNKWAQRASGAMAQMKAVEGVDSLDELLKDEAIGKVRQNVAEAFAELDMLLEQDSAKQAMALTDADSNDPLLIEGSAVEVPHFFDDKVKVPA